MSKDTDVPTGRVSKDTDVPTGRVSTDTDVPTAVVSKDTDVLTRVSKDTDVLAPTAVKYGKHLHSPEEQSRKPRLPYSRQASWFWKILSFLRMR